MKTRQTYKFPNRFEMLFATLYTALFLTKMMQKYVSECIAMQCSAMKLLDSFVEQSWPLVTVTRPDQ